jgi:segregation and condensation protein B
VSTPETSEEATSPVDTDSTETVGTAGETASSAAAVEAAGDAAPTDAVPADVAPADAVSAEGGPTYATPSDAPPSDDLGAGEEIEEPPAPLDSDDELDAVCEALLLVVDTPIHEDSLAHTLGQTGARVLEALHRLSARYTDANSGIDLRRIGDGWRFYTRDIYAPYVEKLLLDGQRAKLTRAALETLAVIAYRQPVTRSRVAAVRGVNVDGVMRTLLARGLVEEVGTDTDTQGTLYRTTELFLERIGLSTLDDLPPIAPLLPEVDSIDDVI